MLLENTYYFDILKSADPFSCFTDPIYTDLELKLCGIAAKWQQKFALVHKPVTNIALIGLLPSHFPYSHCLVFKSETEYFA